MFLESLEERRVLATITGGTGPGGFELANGASTLALWLDGSDVDANGLADSLTTGATVSTWDDRSGYNRDATVNTGTPSYVAASAAGNNMPAVGFNIAGGHDQLVTAYNFDNLGANYSVFGVSRYTGGANERIISSLTRNWLYGHWSNNDKAFHFEGWVNSTQTDPQSSGNLTAFHTYSAVIGPAVPNANIVVDGTAFQTNATGYNGGAYKPGQLSLGRWQNSEASNAEIGEVIIIDRNVNDAERRIIENALSAKYNVPIAAAQNVYAGDDAANGHFDREVFGIGRVSGTHQLLSAGQGGFGIEAAAIADDGTFVLAGHNTPTNSFSTTGIAGTGAARRWDRSWYVDVTNPNDNVGATLAFDYSDAGLSIGQASTFKLLRSTDGGATFTDVGASGTLSGTDLVTFNVTAAQLSTGIYTLGDSAGPVLISTPGAISHTIGAAPTTIDAGLNVAPGGTADALSATISIVGFVNGDTDVLDAANSGGLSESYNATTGVLTLTGADTIANYQTYLRSVTFAKSSFQNTASRDIVFQVNDTAGLSGSATRTIVINASAAADILTWDGNSDGDGNGSTWSDPLNWSADRVPDANDIANFADLAVGTVDVSAPATVGRLQFTGAVAPGFTISASGSGVLTLTDATTAVQSTASVSNTISAPLVLTGSSIVDVSASADLTISGTIGGAVGLTKAGAGALILGGANSYTGGTNVNSGTLKLAGSGTFSEHQAYQITTNSNGGQAHGGSLGYDFTVNPGKTISVTQLGFYDANLNGLGEAHDVFISSVGGGTTFVSGVVPAGTVTTLSAGYRFQPLAVPVNLGPGTYTVWGYRYSVDQDFNVGGVEAGPTFGGPGGELSFVINSGKWNPANAYPVNADGTGTAHRYGAVSFMFSAAVAAAVNIIPDLSTVTVAAGALLDINGNLETIGALAGDGTVQNTSAGPAGITTGANNISTTFAGTIQNNISLTKIGGGTQTLSGANTYAGGTTINGGTLQLAGGADRLPVGTQLTLGALGTLDLNNQNQTVASLSGSGRVVDSTSDATFPVLNVNIGGSSTFSGILGNANQNGFDLVKSGAGTLTLTGANTFTGKTSITAGTLSVNADAAFGTAPGAPVANQITIANNATLTAAAGFTLNANRGITLGASGGTINTPTGVGVTYAGVISGGTVLNKIGVGDFILTGGGLNTPGTININAGRYFFNSQNALGTGPVNINNTGTLDYLSGGALTLTNAINIASGGNIASRGTSLTTNATLPTAGTLIINQDDANTGTVILTSGIALSGALTIQVGGGGGNGGVGRIDGLISGNQTITKTQNGILHLNNGGNSFGGALQIAAGTVRVTADGALGTTAGGTTVGVGSTLEFNGAFNYTTAEPISLGGAGVGGVGALNKVNGSGSISTPLSLNDGATIGSGTAGSLLTINLPIDMNTSSLTFAGAGDIAVPQAITGDVVPGPIPELGGVTAGLEVWFDAADIDGGFNGTVGDPSPGATVTTWQDKSPNNHDATLAVETPQVLGNALNGLPVVEAVGEEYFNVTGAMFAKTIFSVFRAGSGRTTWDNYGATLNRTSGRESNWLFESGNTVLHGNQYPQQAFKNGTQLASPFNLSPINQFMVFTVEVNAGNQSDAAYWLGRSDHSQSDIELAEVVAYDVVLSSGQRNAVQAYLAQKWGISGNFSGLANDVIKTGTGTVTFGGNNTYTGSTTVDAGTLVVTHANALGTTAGGTTVNAGATLGLSGGLTIAGEALSINGNGAAGQPGAIVNVSGNNTFASNVVLTGAQATIGSTSGTLTVNGNVDMGNSTLTIDGAGNVSLLGNLSGNLGSGAVPDLGAVTSGLEIWLDASDITGLSNGQAVTTWSDSSGNAHHATASGSPIYEVAGLNGKPAVRLNSAGFNFGNLSSFFPSAATAFFVVKLENDSSYTFLTTHNSNDTWLRWDGNGLAYPGMFRSPRIEGYTDMPSNGTFLFDFVSSGTKWELFENGASQGVGAPSYSAGDNYQIGLHNSRDLDGLMAEMVVYDRTLSAVEQQSVWAYLSNKYAIAGSFPPISFSNDVTKNGTGAVTLSGNNSYGGTTTVNAGVLSVNNAFGSATGAGNVNVNAGAMLFGTGIIAGTVNVNAGALISPGGGYQNGAFGTSPLNVFGFPTSRSVPAGAPLAGTLTVGALNLAPNSIATTDITSGTVGDRTVVTSAAGVNIANGTAIGTGEIAPSVTPLGTLIVLDNQGGGPVIGNFAQLPDDSTFSFDGITTVIDYDFGNENNDVALIFNRPPTISPPTGAVAASEGQRATASGTYSDPDAADNVIITASVGTVTKTGTSSGTWTWTGPITTDGPATPPAVIITATDPANTTATTNFTYTVNNVAPTLTLSGAASVNEGAVYTLNLAKSDPGTDTITGWTINWGDGSAPQTVGNVTSVTHTFADGTIVRTISATATDEDGTYNSNNFNVTVNDVAPTLVISGLASVNEGASYTLNLSATDPGADPITQWIITWGDGNVETVPGNPASWTHIYRDGPLNASISATVVNGDTQTAVSNALSVQVVNVAPVPKIDDVQVGGNSLSTIPATIGSVPGVPVMFVFSATDVAPDPLDAPFTFTINWGNGTFSESKSTPGLVAQNVPVAFTYDFAGQAFGTYQPTISVVDNDGSPAGTIVLPAIKLAQAITVDGVLYVGGSDGADRIVIKPGGSAGALVQINGAKAQSFSVSSKVVVFGNGGSDTITTSLFVPVEFYGGAGNDYLAGGGAADLLDGGDDSDRILGGGGDDVLLGGAGADTLTGGAGHDWLEGDAYSDFEAERDFDGLFPRLLPDESLQGNDTLNSDAGNDTANGQGGNDRVYGGAGNDVSRGGDGQDTVDGGVGNDLLIGDAGGDLLYGRAGSDVLIGGGGSDQLYGYTGADLLFGGDLADPDDLDSLNAMAAMWFANDKQGAADALESLAQDDNALPDLLHGEADADWYLMFMFDALKMASDSKSPNKLIPLP